MAWSTTAALPKPKELLMPQRPTSILTTLAVSLLALTLIAPWALGQDPTETRRLAEQGDADAQFNLGVMYANGEGVPQDDAEAVRWYRLSADQGNAFAQYDLGVMYAIGLGVPQDDAEARALYRLAADQGYASAQYKFSYAIGLGIPQMTRPKPCVGIGSQPNRGLPLRVQPRGQVRQSAWAYRKTMPKPCAGRLSPAEQGERRCAVQPRGHVRRTALGVPQDEAEAVRWFRPYKLIRGTPVRRTTSGSLYAIGLGVPQDEAEAVRWYRLSADQGNADAQNNLGFSYGHRPGHPTRTRPKPCVGIGSQPIRGILVPLRKTTSGSGTPTARVSSRTRPRPCAGIGSQPIRGTPLAQNNLGFMYWPTARVSSRTRLRPCAGIGSQPIRGRHDAQNNLGVMYANGKKGSCPQGRCRRPCAGIASTPPIPPGNASAHGWPSALRYALGEWASSRIPCSRTCGSTSLAPTGTKLPGKRRDNLERDMTRDEITRATGELARACMASDYQDCER